MSATHHVATSAALLNALKTAQTGDVIALAAGDYGKLTLKGQAGFDMNFAGGVTLVSADANDPATLTGLDLRGAANLTFEGIRFDYRFAQGDVAWVRPFQIIDSQNITISDAVFDGDVASGVSEAVDGFGNGFALSVTGSNGITVEDSTLHGFVRGMVVSDSQNITIADNDIFGMRSDGLNFNAVTDVAITDNHIHNFASAPDTDDHPDFIQFWTRGTDTPSTDITISGNTLDIGNGTPAQSIFIRNDLVDRGLAGSEMFYRDITITENVIVNAHTHGITVGETQGLVIAKNSVLHADGAHVDGADASVEIPRIRVSEDAVNVQITQNISGGVFGPTGLDHWLVSDNVTVQDQDPDAPGYYGDVFLASSLTPVDGVHNFQAIPDGALAQVGAGAAATYAGFAGGDGTFLTAQFQASPDPQNAAVRLFEASTTPNDAGVSYHWDFGDGVTAVGAAVSHAYTGGGTYDVILTVSDGGGASTSAVARVDVAGPQVLELQPNGQFLAYEMGDATLLDGMGQGDTGGLYLGGPGVTTQVDRAHVDDILNTDEFAIAMTLQSHAVGDAGEVFRLHGSFLTQVNTAGEMTLYAWGKDAGLIKLKTSGASLNDMDTHDVVIALDDGALTLTVDGVGVSAAMAGELADSGRLDLMFGNPWGKANFASTVTAFDVTVDAGDYTAGGVLGAADSFEFASGGDAPDGLAWLLDLHPAFGEVTPDDVTGMLDQTPLLDALIGPIIDEMLF